MTRSLRALLTGIIDYAGLFPPAQLPLEQVFSNYLEYRSGPDSWMLASLVIPVGRLQEVVPLANGLSPRLGVSVLGRGGKDTETFAQGVEDDIGDISTFNQTLRGSALTVGYEVRLPPGFLRTASAAEAKQIGPLEDVGEVHNLTPYCEITPEINWRGSISSTTASLSRGTPRGSCGLPVVVAAGFKLRCGGLEAAAFPTPELVAFAIAACRDAKIPMKFTAGLHHPIRHYNDSVQTKMHGFINVFVAGVMAHARGLSAVELQPLLEEENPAEFVFIDDGVHWRDCFATTGEIVAARQHFVTSFGSCSFDEPRDDLRALGWM